MAENISEKVTSGFMWSFAERIFAQGVSFVISVILARLLLPEEYGIVAIVMIVISIFNVFVSDGIGSALIQKKDADDKDFSTLLYFGIIVSVILYWLLFILAPTIGRFYNMPSIVSVIRVMAIRLPLSGINTIQNAYVSRSLKFKLFFVATSIGTVVSGIVGVVLAYLGYGVWSIVTQYLLNTVIDTITLGIVIKWRPKVYFSWKRLVPLIMYSWKILVAGLMEQVYQELRSLVIGKKYTESALAFYSKGKQFPNLVVNNVNAAISKTLFPAMALRQNDILEVKRMTRRAISLGMFVITPFLVGIAMVAESLVILLLTEKWLPCVAYLQVFSIAAIVRPISTANLQAIKAIGRSDWYLRIEIVKRVIGIMILIVSVVCYDGVMAILYGYLIATYIGAMINAVVNIKLLSYTIREQLVDIIPTIIISIIMGMIVGVLGKLESNTFLVLLIQIVSGIFVYVFTAKIFKNENYIYLVKLIKKLLRRSINGK